MTNTSNHDLCVIGIVTKTLFHHFIAKLTVCIILTLLIDLFIYNILTNILSKLISISGTVLTVAYPPQDGSEGVQILGNGSLPEGIEFFSDVTQGIEVLCQSTDTF